jgi:tRNA pseudouridine38-40 synthase
VRLTIGYDGTDLSGSQLQPGRRTVQGELERAIADVGAGETRLTLAGRTDRGVHAIGQVASGELDWRRSEEDLREALNAVLPVDVVVRDVVIAEPGFHARYSARWREYRYRIVEAATPPVLDRRYVWWRKAALDEQAAVAVAQRLVGRHCFGSFAGFGKSRSLTAAELERTVFCSAWRTRTYEGAGGVAREHEYRIVADGYWPQMVRAIVGAIVEVAQGRQDLTWIDTALATSDRSLIGESAPPCGLTLWRVGYNDDVPGAWSGRQDEREEGWRDDD